MILPNDLLEFETNAICSRYKIGHDHVKRMLCENIKTYPKLIKKIQESKAGDDITRFKDYKLFVKNVKKQIYYDLRKYHKDKNTEIDLRYKLEKLISINATTEEINRVVKELLLTHISTQERVPFYEMFYKTLFDIIDAPHSIVDIGCGLHPLSFPFEQQKECLKTYLAIDKDPEVITTLRIFADYVYPVKLIPVCMDINEISWSDFVNNDERYDFAFMLKLVPVLYRQGKDSVMKLVETPANIIQLTGNIEAMTRKDTIMRRENKVLKKFIANANKQIIDSFEIGNEFGYLIT